MASAAPRLATDGRELLLDARGESAASSRVPARSPSARMVADVGQSAVRVQEQRDSRALELLVEVGLCVVHDHEVRLERQHALDSRIEQPDARQPFHLGGEAIVVATPTTRSPAAIANSISVVRG